MLQSGRCIMLQSASLCMMSDGDIILDHLCFLINTLKSSSFLCSAADKPQFPRDNCVTEPFHNSASVLNPERSRFLCIFWLRMRFKYIKMETAFVRGRSGMLMLTHPHTWSCQRVMQHDLCVVGLRECFRYRCSVRSTPGGIQRDMHLHYIIKVTLLSL